MNTNKLIVRADATESIGMGHLRRCLSITEEWIAQGGEVDFVTNTSVGSLKESIVKTGSNLIPIDKPHPSPHDLMVTTELLRRNKNAWIIVDGYYFDESYHASIKKEVCNLLVIDDGINLKTTHADIVVNQNHASDFLKYQGSQNTVFLLGTRYAMLSSQYRKHINVGKVIPSMAHRLIITMGGSDISNQTLTILETISRNDLSSTEIVVVVGPTNPHLEALEEFAMSTETNIVIRHNVDDMSSILKWSDISINAGGSTCWEMAFMGVPMIIVTVAENQKTIAESLAAEGAAVNLGPHEHIDYHLIPKLLKDILQDSKKRGSMSDSGRTLVDGLGCSRIVSEMKKMNSLTSKARS